jgi:hypothetical protein
MIETTKSDFDKSKLLDFNELEHKVFGFFTYQSAALWDSFLCHQKEKKYLVICLKLAFIKDVQHCFLLCI